jgi:hypothetical protein
VITSISLLGGTLPNFFFLKNAEKTSKSLFEIAQELLVSAKVS